MLRPLLTCLPGLLLLAGWLSPGPLAAAGIDTTYTAEKFNLALIAHPARLLSMPQFAFPQAKSLLDSMQQDSGVDPRSVTELQVFVATRSVISNGNSAPPTMGVVVRSARPLDQAAILERGFADATRVDDGQFVIHAAADDEEPSVAFPDGQTMVVSDRQTLHAMLSKRAQPSPLQQRLEALNSDDLISFVVVMDTATRDGLNAFAGALPQQAPFDSLARVPDLLEAIQLTVSGKDLGVNVKLKGRDRAAAGELEKITAMGLEIARGGIEAQLEALADAPENVRIGMEPPLRIAESLLSAAKPELTDRSEVALDLSGTDVQKQMG